MTAQPVGFERWEPGQPWGSVIYSDGERTPVHDPDGAIEAETRQYGARFNSMPKPAPEPTPERQLTGAAGPPLPPSTPSPPPQLPSGEPVSAEEKKSLEA